MIYLIVQRQTTVLQSRQLSSAPVTIGASDTADIQLPDTALRGIHACLERRKRSWWIMPQLDAPLYLNAQIISRPALLRVNDIVNMGEYSLFLSVEPDSDVTAKVLVKKHVCGKINWRWLLLLIVVVVSVLGVFQPDYVARHSNSECPNHSHAHPIIEKPADTVTAEQILRSVHRLKANGDLDSLFAAKQLLGQTVFQGNSDSLLLSEFIEIDQLLYQQMKAFSARPLSTDGPEPLRTKQRIPDPVTGDDSAKPAHSNILSNEGNQPPVVRDFWLLRDAVLRGTRTPAVILATDPDGDSLSYEWHAFYGSIIGKGANVLYATPDELPPFSEDLVTVTVSDNKNPPQQFFKSIQVLETFPIVSEQKLVAREFYNLALVYEIHYQDLVKAEEYLRKAMFVAPDTTFSFYGYAKKRLEKVLESKNMSDLNDF